MSAAPVKPSGIKPPTSRLVRPSVTSKPSSNGSSGENIAGRSNEDLTKKKISDRYEGLDDDDDLDRVSDLPSLPGSRKTSEQMRKLSDGSGSALDAAYELARRLSEAGVRRMSDASIVLTTDTDSFIIGQRIYVNGVKPGMIQFIGETKFAPGEWAGIVLDDLSGKNDGSVGGVRYFQCQPKKGVFSRLTRLTRQPLDAIQLAALQTQQTQPPATNENGDESLVGSTHSTGANNSNLTSPVATTPNSVVSVQSIGDLRLGDRVIVTSSQGSKAGILRYLGTAEFAAGQWAGVELDDPLGKNDGAVAGTRYFDCQAHYGLFAPVHKVSRSPANQMRRTSGAMNNSMSSSGRTGLMSRQGTRDSIGGSSAASVASVATSRASTAISRVRSTMNNPRLGVNSLTTNSPTHQSSRQKPSRPSVGGSAHSNLQDLMRERDQHIEQLMKEREMERSEVTRAAAQADEAEHQLALLQRRFKDEKESFQTKLSELESLLVVAESVRSSQAAQIDDLQFRLEEESILRADIEAQQKGLDDKEKEWARQVEQLEKEAQRCFEAEELAARYKDELDALTSNKGQQQESSSAPGNDQSDERIRQLEASVQTKETELLQLKNSVEELTKSLQDEQLNSRNSEERFQALEKDLQTARTWLSEAKSSGDAEVGEWKSKLEILEKQNAESQEQLDKLNEEKTQFETQLNEARALLDRTKETSETETCELKAKLEEMVRLDGENKDQMFTLHEEKAQLEAQLEDILSSSNQTKHAGEMEINELKAKVDELERRAAESEEQLFKLDEEKVRLELQLADSHASSGQLQEAGRAETEKMKQELEELTMKYGVLESHEVESKERYAKVEEEKVKLESELQTVKASLAEKEESTKTQTENKNKDFEALSAKYETLERQAADSKERLIKMEAEKTQLEAELRTVQASLTDSLEAAKSDSETKKKEIEELQTKLEDAESKASEIKEQLTKLGEEKIQLAAQLQTVENLLAESKEAAKTDSENKSREIEELNGKCKTLELEEAEIKIQLANLQDEKTKCESALQKKFEEESEIWGKKCEDFERQKTSSDQRITQLGEEKSRLESELLHLSSSSSNASQDLTRLHGELMAARQVSSESQSRVSQLEADKISLEQLTSSLRVDVKNRDEKISELSTEKTDLERQIQEIGQSLKDAQTQLEKDKEKYEKLSSELRDQLQSQEEKMNTLITVQADLQAQLETSNETLAVAQAQSEKQKADLEQSKNELGTDLNTKEKLIADLRTAASEYEGDLNDAKLECNQLKEQIQTNEENIMALKGIQTDLQAQLEMLNETLTNIRAQSEKEKTELEESKIELSSELANKEKLIADLRTAASEYESDLNDATQECSRLKEQLKILESHQQESLGGVAELQKCIAGLEIEKSSWAAEKLGLEESISRLEKQLSTLSSEKEESSLEIQERDSRLAQLTEEVAVLQEKFKTHIAELEKKLNENRKAEETEQELQLALTEARGRADELETALEESQKSEKELLQVREQLASANKLHEEFIEKTQKEQNELKQNIEELSTVKNAMEERESKLQEELVTLKRQLDEQGNRLQGHLQETKQEAETVRQLLRDLEDTQHRAKELQAALDESEQRLTESQDVALRVKGLEEQLELKTQELKEEMDDRDKAEDRVLRLTENLSGRDKELEALRHEITELRRSTTDVSHLLTAFSIVDREKKQLESKVVELQVAAAAASRGAGAEAAETDVRIKQLKEDYEMSQKEINFLNSVIVDMQRKLDDLKLKLEVSEATLLGKNILTPETNRNGVKPAAAPRLFCDICDIFDLHDTEDCPKQSSEDFEIAPVLLHHHSPVFTQHSHHGGQRGASRPYCDNCEVFGHATSECEEEATF